MKNVINVLLVMIAGRMVIKLKMNAILFVDRVNVINVVLIQVKVI